MSLRVGHRRLSPLVEKEEQDNAADKGETLRGQNKTAMMTFPPRTFGGSLISEGHRNLSPTKFYSFGTLGKASKSSEIGASKNAGNVLQGDTPDTPKSGISRGATPEGLHLG